MHRFVVYLPGNFAKRKRKYYRVTVNNGNPLYNYVKERCYSLYGPDSVQWRDIRNSSHWLPSPDAYKYRNDLQSWFTNEGFRRIRPTLDLMKKYVPDLSFNLETREELNPVIYHDRFQRVVQTVEQPRRKQSDL